MKIVCAWCGKDMGEKAPEEPGTTHGICERCRLETQTPEVRYGREKIEKIVGKLRDIKTVLHKTRRQPGIFRNLLFMANDLTKMLSEGETVNERPARAVPMVDMDRPAPEKTTWVPIQDRLPPAIRFLHVLRLDCLPDLAVMSEHGEWLDTYLDPIDDVTHWGKCGEQPAWYHEEANEVDPRQRS